MNEPQAAARYARAFFEVASAKSALAEDLIADLVSLKTALESDPWLWNVFRNPLINSERKRDLAASLLSREADSTVLHFLSVLIEKGRIDLFFQIVERLQELLNEAKGIQEATVFSARPVERAARDRLEAALQKMTHKKIVLREEIDPDLLGGIQVRIANRLVDGSLKTRLDSLRSALMEIGK